MPSKSEAFERRVQEMQAAIDSHESTTGGSCVPNTLIVGTVLPLILFLVFYFVPFGFLNRQEGKKSVKDNKKVFLYTLLFSVLAWLGLYLYTRCNGDLIGLVCSR